ncbi:MAG TPA: glycosyltransferase family 2 protein [Ignavibacteria bacterium]|nr:glycosyltransferase family 2 protein [Ignavibacteria bacterium]
MINYSFIIVNYNSTDKIIRCINSIINTLNENYEIIIVDNNSPDRDKLKSNKLFEKTKIILNNINDGFGKACNIGAINSSGQYLIFINPDTYFLSNVIPEIITFYNRNINIGFVTCSMLDESGNYSFTFNDFYGIKYEINEAFGFGTNQSIQKKYKLIQENYGKKIEVDWITGSFMFISKEKFNTIGGFDENFFLYYEDTDICLRAYQSGLKNYVITYINIIHEGMSTVKSIEGEYIFFYHLNRSNLLYAYKHFNFFSRFFVRIIHIIGYSLRIALLNFRKKFKDKKKLKNIIYFDIIKLYLTPIKIIINNKNIDIPLKLKNLNLDKDLFQNFLNNE